MAIRKPWLLLAAIMMVLGMLGMVVFGGAAIRPAQEGGILRVPGSYGSIQAAINAASPGDTIVVAPGTYHEAITLNKPVSLVAAGFDAANAANNLSILDGGSADVTLRISRDIAPMPMVRGLVIRNGRTGIEARSPFTVENSFFYGSQVGVHYLINGGGINRSNVYFNSGSDAVHVDDMTAALQIQGNRFLYSGNDAIEIDFPGTSATNPPVQCDIRDNLLIGSQQDGIKFMDYGTNPGDARRRVVIAGNLIANNRRAGIGVVHNGSGDEDYSGADAAESIRVYNDTFYGNNYGISGGANTAVINSIIANSSSLGTWRVRSSDPLEKPVVAYTLFFNNRVDGDQTFTGPGNIQGQDPLFVAPPGPGPDGAWGDIDDDFNGLQLRPGSPAVDKGTLQYRVNIHEMLPDKPLSGYAGAAPDLGWKELGSAASALPTPTAGIALGVAVTPNAATADLTSAAVASTTAMPTLPSAASAPLVLQSVSPTSVRAHTSVTMTLKGAGFQPGTGIAFEGEHEAPPQITAMQLVDSNTIVLNVNVIDDSEDVDHWNVQLTNPDGTTATLLSALTVTP